MTKRGGRESKLEAEVKRLEGILAKHVELSFALGELSGAMKRGGRESGFQSWSCRAGQNVLPGGEPRYFHRRCRSKLCTCFCHAARKEASP